MTYYIMFIVPSKCFVLFYLFIINDDLP